MDARREHESIISSLDFFIYRQEMLYIEIKTDCNHFIYYSILCLISYVVLITMISLAIGFNRIYLYFLCNNLNYLMLLISHESCVNLCISLLILCKIVYNIKGEKNASTKENN